MPLNNVARAAIAELERDGVSPLTPDEVVLLQEIGARMLDASKQAEYGEIRLAPPVAVGNAVLHPPTCASSDFIARFAPVMDGENGGGVGVFWLIVFALAHARQPHILRELHTGEAVYEAVREWRCGLSCTYDELEAALGIVTEDGDSPVRATEARIALFAACSYVAETDPDAARKAMDALTPILDRREEDRRTEYERRRMAERPDALSWFRFAAELGAMTGVSPDYWYREDRRLVLHCFRMANEARRSFGAGRAFGRKEPSSETNDAIRDMVKAKNDIRSAFALRTAHAAEKETDNGRRS